jgi:hypothetical protein
MFAEPGFREASLAQVAAAVQRRQLAREALAELSEAELFRRIFGQDAGEMPARE